MTIAPPPAAEASGEPALLTLEFARSESTGDPHTFRFGPQTYIVRTPRGGFGASELVWDSELLSRLTRVRLTGQDPTLLAEVGEVLRKFLIPAGWELHERELSAAIARGRPVHVTIRSAAAELYALPWELLTLRASGQCLGGLPGVLVRYEWPETETAARREPSATSPRVLVAWSAAGGAVPAAEHIVAIRAAAAAGGLALDPDDVLSHASPARIAQELGRGEREGRPYAALHVLCHGGARGSLFGLVLDADAADDAPVLLDPARLQQLVAPYAATLRLVVLAACDSGNQGAFGGLIGSTAQMLHRAGLAAVVASRYPLSVVGSEHLTATLYRGLLAEHRSLEQAFVAARTVLAGDTTRLDWASVQLYARAADGAASFLLAGPSSTPARPARAPRSRARVPAIAAAGVLTAVLGATWLATAPAEQPPPVDPTPPPIFDPKPSPESRDPTPPPAVPLKPVLKDVHPAPPLEPDPKSKAVKKKPEPPKPPEPPPESVECSSALRTFVHNVLPGSGTRVVTIVVKASRDGSMKVTGTDTPAIAAAREQLEVATPEQVKTYAAALPCHFTYKWKHPASP